MLLHSHLLSSDVGSLCREVTPTLLGIYGKGTTGLESVGCMQGSCCIPTADFRLHNGAYSFISIPTLSILKICSGGLGVLPKHGERGGGESLVVQVELLCSIEWNAMVWHKERSDLQKLAAFQKMEKPDRASSFALCTTYVWG